jgi:hypothetical protein
MEAATVVAIVAGIFFFIIGCVFGWFFKSFQDKRG